MSAEKEIVNFWCNKRGYFTINNIKTSNNRDVGILALKFKDGVIEEINHIEVSCSIIGSIDSIDDAVANIVYERFENKNVIKALKGHLDFKFDAVNRFIVLGVLPKSRKRVIVNGFKESNVEVIEFEDILMDILGSLDTQYYKNDVLRTLQLVKYLFLSEPKNLSDLLIAEIFSPSARKEFLNSILDKEEIVKEFRKTNEERLGAILKNSGLKPYELAELIETNILNRKTRRLFLNSLMGQEKARKSLKRTNKANVPLNRFFR